MTSANITVVIPCFRCKETIGRAITSVYSQTIRPLELVLVDDCSDDGTLEFLYSLQRKYSGEWIKIIALQQNDGPGTARNTGWDSARGQYVAFLDADDAWHPQKIEIQYGWMLAHPDVYLTAHRCELFNESKVDIPPLQIISRAYFSPVSGLNLLYRNRFPTRSVMLRRDLPYRYLSGKRHSEDFLLWLQICLDKHKCYLSRLTLAYTFKAEFGEGGLSGDLWLMEKGELDTYFRLFRSGRINVIVFLGVSTFSMAKFFRRRLSVWMKNIVGH